MGVSVLSRPLAIAITILVSLVWAGNVAVGMFYPDRHDAAVNAIFAIIVGAAFGLVPKRDALATARRRLAARIAGDDQAADATPDAAEDQPQDAETPRGDSS